MLALTSSEWDITDAIGGRAVHRRRRRGDQLRGLHQGRRRRGRRGARRRRQRRRARATSRTPAPGPARSSSTSPPTTCSPASSTATARRPYEIDDETGPLSVYGRTKLAGEFAVLAAMPDAHIVRTAWIYEGARRHRLRGDDAPAGGGRRDGGCGRRPGGLADLCRRPGRCAARVADGDIREPVLHAANEGEASRFEQAQAVFEAVGADPARVRPVGSDAQPAARATAAVFGVVGAAVRRSGADAAAAVA